MATDDLSDDDTQTDDPGRLRRMYEDQAKARAAAESELATLKAEKVFRDAGLDTANPLHQAVMRGYTGEVDPEAVQSYVTELGVTSAPDPAPEPATDPTPPQERQALEAIARAGAGDGTPPPSPDPREKIRQDMEAAARKGNLMELNRLSTELSRASGYLTKADTDNPESPSLPNYTQVQATLAGDQI